MADHKSGGALSRPPNDTVITYVLEYPGTHLIKIGQAKYYQDRIAQLRNGSPIVPKPLCAFMGAEMEHELHERFKHLWAHGEFFHYTKEIKDYLESASGRMTHEEAIKISPRVIRKRERKDNLPDTDLELMPSLETNE
jgi:T5orf172 domain-containing protein